MIVGLTERSLCTSGRVAGDGASAQQIGRETPAELRGYKPISTLYGNGEKFLTSAKGWGRS